jgi:hypothetical protein
MSSEDETSSASSSGGQVIQTLPKINRKPDCTNYVQSGFILSIEEILFIPPYARGR